MRKQHVFLQHIAQLPRLPADVPEAAFPVRKLNGTAVRCEKAGKDVEQRCFAHAADTQEANQLAIRQMQVDISQDLVVPV